MLLSLLLKLSTLFHLGKMDKRIRPFEDIAPLNVRYRVIFVFIVSTLFSINLFISSFDSIAETTMDFGLTFIMRLRWQELRFRKLTLVRLAKDSNLLNLEKTPV